MRFPKIFLLHLILFSALVLLVSSHSAELSNEPKSEHRSNRTKRTLYRFFDGLFSVINSGQQQHSHDGPESRRNNVYNIYQQKPSKLKPHGGSPYGGLYGGPYGGPYGGQYQILPWNGISSISRASSFSNPPPDKNTSHFGGTYMTHQLHGMPDMPPGPIPMPANRVELLAMPTGKIKAGSPNVKSLIGMPKTASKQIRLDGMISNEIDAKKQPNESAQVNQTEIETQATESSINLTTEIPPILATKLPNIEAVMQLAMQAETLTPSSTEIMPQTTTEKAIEVPILLGLSTEATASKHPETTLAIDMSPGIDVTTMTTPTTATILSTTVEIADEMVANDDPKTTTMMPILATHQSSTTTEINPDDNEIPVIRPTLKPSPPQATTEQDLTKLNGLPLLIGLNRNELHVPSYYGKCGGWPCLNDIRPYLTPATNFQSDGWIIVPMAISVPNFDAQNTYKPSGNSLDAPGNDGWRQNSPILHLHQPHIQFYTPPSTTLSTPNTD